jgi:hypothetical protein
VLGNTNNNLDNYVINQTANLSVGPLAISMSITDSGATSHFVTIDAPIINGKVTNNPLTITAANGEIMYSTHGGTKYSVFAFRCSKLSCCA